MENREIPEFEARVIQSLADRFAKARDAFFEASVSASAECMARKEVEGEEAIEKFLLKRMDKAKRNFDFEFSFCLGKAIELGIEVGVNRAKE